MAFESLKIGVHKNINHEKKIVKNNTGSMLAPFYYLGNIGNELG